MTRCRRGFSSYHSKENVQVSHLAPIIRAGAGASLKPYQKMVEEATEPEDMATIDMRMRGIYTVVCVCVCVCRLLYRINEVQVGVSTDPFL